MKTITKYFTIVSVVCLLIVNMLVDHANAAQKSNKFLDLLKAKETKLVLNNSKLKGIEKDYYLHQLKYTECEKRGKGLIVYRKETQRGVISVDSHYIATVKSIMLAADVEGEERDYYSPWDQDLSSEVVMWNKTMKVLWSKKYETGVDVRKISSNCNSALIILPDKSEKALSESDFPFISIVYDKKGVELFKYHAGGNNKGVKMTDNGKYISIGEGGPERYQNTWTIINLETMDSIEVIRQVGEEGPPHIFNNGVIEIWSKGNKVNRMHFDSLKSIQRDKR